MNKEQSKEKRIQPKRNGRRPDESTNEYFQRTNRELDTSIYNDEHTSNERTNDSRHELVDTDEEDNKESAKKKKATKDTAKKKTQKRIPRKRNSSKRKYRKERADRYGVMTTALMNSEQDEVEKHNSFIAEEDDHPEVMHGGVKEIWERQSLTDFEGDLPGINRLCDLKQQRRDRLTALDKFCKVHPSETSLKEFRDTQQRFDREEDVASQLIINNYTMNVQNNNMIVSNNNTYNIHLHGGVNDNQLAMSNQRPAMSNQQIMSWEEPSLLEEPAQLKDPPERPQLQHDVIERMMNEYEENFSSQMNWLNNYKKLYESKKRGGGGESRFVSSFMKQKENDSSMLGKKKKELMALLGIH